MAIIKHASSRLVARAARPASLLSSKAGQATTSTLLQRKQQCSFSHTAATPVAKQTFPLSIRSHCSPQKLAVSSPLHSSRIFSQCRNASTAPAKEAVAAAVNTPTGPSEVLTWNEFLRLRKIRRRFNVVASASLAAASFVTGLGWLSEQNLEQLGAQFFGMDPLFVMGLSALGFAGVGWVIGPFLGSAVWRASYSSRVKGMAAKERDFFDRIRKYRVDPTNSSMQNPVPDYYGEKITSVQGYRQWLKDQRAYNKKRQVQLD